MIKLQVDLYVMYMMFLEADKVHDTKMMMNTVRNSIYYLLYVYHNMYK